MSIFDKANTSGLGKPQIITDNGPEIVVETVMHERVDGDASTHQPTIPQQVAVLAVRDNVIFP